MSITSGGITVEPPAGCEARIRTRPAEAGAAEVGTAALAPEVNRPVVHVSTTTLFEDRGDFGSGVVEAMGTGDVLVTIVELDPAQAGTALIGTVGTPRSVPVTAYDPQAMQRTIHGQSGAQVFFSEHGRAFCLYVVLGSHARRHELAPVVDRILAGVTIDPS